MKNLSPRHMGMLGLYAAATVAAAAVALLADSDGVRSVAIVGFIALTTAMQFVLLREVRNLIASLRKEERLRHEARRSAVETEFSRLAKLVDPTKQAVQLRRARAETAELNEALHRREEELASLGETLRRIEYELALAANPERDALSRYDGVAEPAGSAAEER